VQKLGETIAKTRAVTKERVDEVMVKFTAAAGAQSLLGHRHGQLRAFCASSRALG
jgi:hypothetical protein